MFLSKYFYISWYSSEGIVYFFTRMYMNIKNLVCCFSSTLFSRTILQTLQHVIHSKLFLLFLKVLFWAYDKFAIVYQGIVNYYSTFRILYIHITSISKTSNCENMYLKSDMIKLWMLQCITDYLTFTYTQTNTNRI